jgi:FkbM family methyltransferase
MQGYWLLEITNGVIRNRISVEDGRALIKGRPKFPPNEFQVGGIHFNDPDGTIWSLVLEVFVRRSYNPRGWEIRRGDVVVDVGAHWGVFSSFAVSQSAGQVIAFEPHPDNFSQLIKLIRRNDLTQVSGNNLAIADYSGHIDLYTSSKSTRHSVAPSDPLTGEPTSQFISVPSVDLPRALIDIDVVDYLKMDCEGAEFGIIMATSENVLRRIRKIVIEYHADHESLALTQLLGKLRSVYPSIHIRAHKSLPLGLILAKQN